MCYNDYNIKYNKDFPELKSANRVISNKISFNQREVGERIYRPLTIKEAHTRLFLRLFNDACKNNRILYPQANKNGNVHTVLEVEKQKIMITTQAVNSYLYYDEVNNKIITYCANGYDDLSGNIISITTLDIPMSSHRSEQLLILSNIKFY